MYQVLIIISLLLINRNAYSANQYQSVSYGPMLLCWTSITSATVATGG